MLEYMDKVPQLTIRRIEHTRTICRSEGNGCNPSQRAPGSNDLRDLGYKSYYANIFFFFGALITAD